MASRTITMYSEKRYELEELKEGIKSEFSLPIHSEENILRGLLPEYNPDSVQQIKNIYGVGKYIRGELT